MSEDANVVFSEGPVVADGTINNPAVFPDSPDFQLDSGTFEFRFTADSVGGVSTLLSKDNRGFGDGGHVLIAIVNGRVVVQIQDDTSTTLLATNKVISADEDTHVAVTFGPDTGLQIFVDGDELAQRNYFGGLTGNTEPIVIGASQVTNNDGSETRFGRAFDGTIEEVAIWDDALDADHIAILANRAPDAVDDTGFAVTTGEELRIAIADLLDNDSDPDGDSIDLTEVTGATIDGTDVVFTAGAPGDASFTYTIADPDGETDSATVFITVEDVAPAGTVSFADATRAVVVDLAADTSAEAARTLLLGDSLTSGFNIPGGWRPGLWDDLTQDQSLWVDFVGGFQDNPGPTFHDLDHQGEDGLRATRLLRNIDDIIADNPSDIALVMIGTNDALKEDDAGDTVPGEILEILEALHAANPNGTFLVAELLPLDTDTFFGDRTAQIAAINAGLPAIIADAQAQGIDAHLVDTSSFLVDNLGFDGIHPTIEGHADLVEIWSDALAAATTSAGGTLNGTPQVIDAAAVNLIGSGLSDRLSGDDAANDIQGRAGDDWIEGRDGDDTLTGEEGRDQFVFDSDDGTDIITDFTVGEDLVYLREADGVSAVLSDDGSDLVIDYGMTEITLLGAAGQTIDIVTFADTPMV